MHWAFWVILAFLCGSIPFSVWLGQIFFKVDVRRYGDGNPGAVNAYKAGNKLFGLLVLLLDVSKAAVPVGLAYYNYDIRGFPLVLIAIAPVLGHAYSPFLRFRGGKAIAAVLGVWIGLTLWKASLAGVILTLVGYALTVVSGWAVMLGLAGILLVLLFWIADKYLLLVWVGVTLILIWKHKTDLAQFPQLRPWIRKILFPSEK